MSLLRSPLKLVTFALALLFLGMALNWLTAGALLRYGVNPRVVDELHHIFFAPFLHADFAHLFNNAAAIAVLGLLCAWRSARLFIWGSLAINLMVGLLVWIFARSAIHIGASGWVFGLWSLLIGLAWWERSFKSLFIALVVLFLYAGILWGVLPTDSRISFEAHIAGVIAGLFTAYMYAKKLKPY